jgi:hypothetical protein
MAGNHQHGARCGAEFTPHLQERGLKLIIGGAAFLLHPRPRTAAMGEEISRQPHPAHRIAPSSNDENLVMGCQQTKLENDNSFN